MATPQQVKRRGRLSLILGAIVASVTLGAVMASGAELVTAELDGTANDVTVVQGSSANFSIKLTATGKISSSITASTPSTAKVDTVYSLDGSGTLSAGTLSAPKSFYAGATGCSGGNCEVTWDGAPTAYSVPATISTAATTPAGDYTITLSEAATTTLTADPSVSGGKLDDNTATTITVHVVDETAPSIAITSPANGSSTTNSSITVSGTASDASGIQGVTVNGNAAPFSAGNWSFSGLTLACGPNTITAIATDDSANHNTASASISVTRTCDTTPPVITSNVSGTLGNNGWYTSDVTLTWHVSEPESPGSLVKTGCVDQNITADQAATTYSCSATSDGGSAGPVNVSIKRDATNPSISGSRSPAANSNGWNNTNVDVNYTCNDNLSGVASCGPDETLSSEGANQSSSGVAVDNAGNSSASATVSGINIDLTDPSVSLVGGPADGASYYFGSVPAAPTCSASDALSGLDGSCSVSGYSNAVGTHTVSASAVDKAGNTASDSRTYTVLPWTLSGFYQPVDMGTSVVNTVKNGSTVPLKFEIFAGSNELTDPADVMSLGAQQVACSAFNGDALDDIELIATGGTALRYDTTAGQFVYNWKTPAKANTCYVVKMTTDDGSSLSAQFKLK
jgi:hypothetical protein